MTSELFRKEVLEAKRSSWLGNISVVQPLKLWIVAVLAFAIAVIVILFLTLGTYTRRSTVSGQLVPDAGLITVASPATGVVVRIFRKEGERVDLGEPLLLIQSQRSSANGEDAISVIREGLTDRKQSLQDSASAQSEQLHTQFLGAEKQLQESQRELVQIESEIQTRRDQVELSRQTVDRYERVAQDKYVSEVQVQQQRQAMLELLNAQKALERQATSIRKTIAQLNQTIQEIPAQQKSVRANSQRELASLDQERIEQEAVGELMIKAPSNGLIASQLVETGQPVQITQSVLSIVPKESLLEAQLLVPSSAIGFVKLGDKVLLRYQAFPYQKFGHHKGKVVRISRSAIPVGGNNAGKDPQMYRVIVHLEQQKVRAFGKDESLRPGMLVDADILGETRKLYEWLFEPLYSLTGNF